MPEDSVKRKLTAILCADVKGYSRMMGEDEVGTFHTLSDYLEIINTIIKTHHGRVFSSPGDAIIAQFASVVDAVECAVEIQNKIETKNADVPEDRKMRFRIGVNLGDVIEKEEQIYGDGVNIAARIETLAEPGKVSISKNVYRNVRNKIKFGYEYQGEHQVKNITEPLRVYKVLTAPEHAGQLIGEPKVPKRLSKKSYISIFVVLALVAAAAVWYFYPRVPEIEPASVEKMAYPLPDKPSIAVLPFDNMSGDPEQDYFSDGISEEIITSLAKTDQLFVIARNSTFTYKGKPVKVKQVAEELGVRYVLEGSVRKSEDRVRITAQLIDAVAGEHLWAERYDRDLKDIFALQDEITIKIVTALQIKLTEGEQARLWGKEFKNLDVYLKFMEVGSLFQKSTKETLIRAGQVAQEIVDMAPESKWGYVMLAWYNWNLAWRGQSPRESIAKAFKLVQKALTIDKSDSNSHTVIGNIYLLMRQYEKAIAAGEQAVALEPNGALAHVVLGITLCYAGRIDEGINKVKQSIRLNPSPAHWSFLTLGRCYRQKGQYEEALTAYKKALQINQDDLLNHLSLAAIYVLLDRQEEAEAAAKKVLEINPKFSVERFSKTAPYKNQADLKLFVDALNKAGLK
jgi:adenylate cyclase